MQRWSLLFFLTNVTFFIIFLTSYFFAKTASAVPGAALFQGNTATLSAQIAAVKFIDSRNSAYFLDPAGTGLSLAVAGSVGIGTTGPSGKLHILDANNDTTPWSRNATLLLGNSNATNNTWQGIQNNDNSGTVNSGIAFINTDQTNHYGRIDFAARGAAGWNGSVMSINNGNVGIGTTAPGQKLSVAGTVESTTGGFKFPDATTQTSAASPITASESVLASNVLMSAAQTWYNITSLSLAAGTYLISGQIGYWTNSQAGVMFEAKLWDGGSNIYSSVYSSPGATNSCSTDTFAPRKIVLSSTTTIYITATSTSHGNTYAVSDFYIFAACSWWNGDTGNTATYITAQKIL